MSAVSARRPSLRFLLLLALILPGVCSGGLLPAQGSGEKATAVAGVEAALAAWSRVEERSEEQRARVLPALAEFADPAITDLLVAELQKARTSAYAEKVLRALGSRPRPGVTRVLLGELLDPGVAPRVRKAAAAALAGQGHRGIDALAGLLQRPPSRAVPGLRLACLQALAGAANDRAYRVLASLSLTGPPSARLQVLRLLDRAGNQSAVTRARLAAAVGENLLLAATAFRQLAELGHSKARALAEDLHLRCGPEPGAAVQVELVRGFAAVLHRDLFRPLLERSAGGNAAVHQAVRKVAPKVMQDARFVRWLAEELPRTLPAERKAAQWYLRAADPQVAAAALDSLRRQLRNPTPEDLDLAVTLNLLLGGDPTWQEDLLRLASSSRPELRAAGLSMLAEHRAEAGLPLALQSVEHGQWPVRAAAYRFLAAVRSVDAIPLLIRRVGRETPRLEQELLDTLMVTTGRRFWQREQWERWWAENREGFELPPPVQMRGGSGSAGSTISYYNIPLVSNRAVFVVDTSGSMNQRLGTDRRRTRLDEAKAQLRRVLEEMPRTWKFNVIPYQSVVDPLLSGLQRASQETVKEVLADIGDLRARGGTNIYAALEAAFNDPDVDTVYLLSDGQPSVGPITDPEELAEEVSQWNRSRQIVIHCISVGMDSRLLRRLAEDSGGTYVRVR